MGIDDKTKSPGFGEKRITLRKFEDNDLLLYRQWLAMPHVAAWYHDPEDWIREVERRNGEFSFLHHFIAELDRPIGFCQYYEYRCSGENWHGDTETDGTYSIDYLIGETDCLGKGFAKQIIGALAEKIMAVNGERIIAQPEPENAASCNTLLSSGFSYDESNGIFIMDWTAKQI